MCLVVDDFARLYAAVSRQDDFRLRVVNARGQLAGGEPAEHLVGAGEGGGRKNRLRKVVSNGHRYPDGPSPRGFR
jgi:hypothetical protein